MRLYFLLIFCDRAEKAETTYIPEMVLPDTFPFFPRPDFLKVRTKIESGGGVCVCVCDGGGGGGGEGDK